MALTQDSDARKRIPMFRGLLAYFPDALAAVAEHSFESNEKHNPGEALHWAREKSADQQDTIIRHMTDLAGEPSAEEKLYAMKCVAWRALAQLQLEIEGQECRNFLTLQKAAVEARTAIVPHSKPLDRAHTIEEVHELQKAAVEAVRYVCRDCDHEFLTPQGLAAHKRGHTRCVPWSIEQRAPRLDVV